MFLAILGCDGSGKSAVIAAVEERVRARGLPVVRGHWRPAVGATSAAGADDPHGKVPRGAFSSFLKLGWLWWNWWLGWFRHLRREAGSGLVLFDRYHADLLVDPRRYRYGGPMWLARWASGCMPQPDRVIFLDAPPEVLLARKQEVSKEALEGARRKYLDLCAGHPRFRVVDASRPLEEVVDAVLGEIRGAGGAARP